MISKGRGTYLQYYHWSLWSASRCLDYSPSWHITSDVLPPMLWMVASGAKNAELLNLKVLGPIMPAHRPASMTTIPRGRMLLRIIRTTFDLSRWVHKSTKRPAHGASLVTGVPVPRAQRLITALENVPALIPVRPCELGRQVSRVWAKTVSRRVCCGQERCRPCRCVPISKGERGCPTEIFSGPRAEGAL